MLLIGNRRDEYMGKDFSCALYLHLISVPEPTNSVSVLFWTVLKPELHIFVILSLSLFLVNKNRPNHSQHALKLPEW